MKKFLYLFVSIYCLFIFPQSQFCIASENNQSDTNQGRNLKKPYKIGLVLSGGGSRGFAHIGVLKKLHKNNIIPDIISGCSMGAFIGAMYASGYSPEEIEKIVLTNDWGTLFSDKPLRSNVIISDRDSADNNYLITFDFKWNKMLWKKAVNDGKFLDNFLASNLSIFSAIADNDFNKFFIPLRIAATDFISGKPEYYKSGNLPEIVRASMSYPGLFSPKQYDNKFLIDGFIASNIPVDVLKNENCDHIIISDVTSDLQDIDKINTILDVLDQTLQIAIQPKIYEDLKKGEIVISPDVKKISTTDFNDISAIIKKGESSVTDDIIKKIKLLKDESENSIVLKNINSYNISKINILNLKKLDKSVVEDYTNSLIKKNYKSEEMLASIYNLYGSGYFDKINYNFQKNETDTDFNLNLYLVEKNYYSLNLGFYADEYYNAVGCLGISKNNIDKFGSKLDFETNFGLYKKIKLKYTTLNTTKLKLTSQITTSYIDSFIKLFNDSFFINNDYFRYKDISFNISKYVSFHSAFNISLNFSKFSSSLNQSTPYSKIELSFKYDNLKDYIFPANSSNFCIKYSKFLSHNYKNSEKLYLGTSYFPLIYRNTLLIINSGIGLSSHEINFIEKFTSGGPDEIPGYYRNEFRTDNLYFLTLGGVYKIREYKSLLKQKIYCSILSGIAEIKNNKNFSFDYNNLLYGITAKFILSTNFGNLEIIGGCNRKKQMHFYFQYGYKL